MHTRTHASMLAQCLTVLHHNCTLYAGIISLVLATLISLYTILQLTWLHEQRNPKDGSIHRMNRYHQLTSHAFVSSLALSHA
jgi:hypothetical protein